MKKEENKKITKKVSPKVEKKAVKKTVKKVETKKSTKKVEGKKTNWIAGATKNKGALHKALGVKEGKKIPAKKLAIKKTDSTKVKKEKVLAKTLKKIK